MQSNNHRLFKASFKTNQKERDIDFIGRVEKSFYPKHYIIDKTFWRSEYNFDEIKTNFYAISEEIKTNLLKGEDYFYENYSGCFNPSNVLI